jgi:crossover junction endodeoxyribonuclease RuvC
MSSKPIAGVDLSLTSTGLSCGDDRTVINSKLKETARLFEIQSYFRTWISSNDFPFCVIEGYSFASKNSQAHKIGELGGVIRLQLHMLGVGYVEVPPTVRAKFATGKGNASKNEVVSAVSARTGIVWSGAGADDLCDAFILEEMGRTVVGDNRYDWPSENKKALDKINRSELEKYYG